MSEKLQENEALDSLKRLSDPSEQSPLQSDAELLSLYVEAGDRHAIEQLIRRYSTLVSSVCRLTVSDPGSAEDAFQATFLILLKSARKIKNRESVASWLHGVAYRTASRMRKLSISNDHTSSDDDVIKATEPQTDPIFQLARKMELEALDRELDQLPERLRAPIVEHYLLGQSAPDIARRMELSTSAVEGRLKRGRRKLRTLLAKRGISLSVLIAASGYFRQHTQAAEATRWTQQFLDEFLPSSGQVDPNIRDFPETTSPDILSLTQKELVMFSPGVLKATAATGIFLVATTLAVVAADRPSRNSGQTDGNIVSTDTLPTILPNQELTIPERDPANMVIAQFGGAGYGGPGYGQSASPPEPAQQPTSTNSQPTSTIPNAVPQPTPSPTPIQTPPYQTPGPYQTATNLPPGTSYANAGEPDWSKLAWQPPTDSNETPVWLTGGKATMDALDQSRAILAQQVNYDFHGETLQQVTEWLTEETGTTFELNASELDLMGVDSDSPIRVSGSGSIRELFRRILEPLELTYRVNESTIEITSRDHAESAPNMRFYDLSYVLPNPSHSDALMNAMQQSIEADSWLANGGTNSAVLVGSMMVVSAPDTTHQKIEVLLINLSRMNPKNVSDAWPASRQPMPAMGGFGAGGAASGGGAAAGGGGFF